MNKINNLEKENWTAAEISNTMFSPGNINVECFVIVKDFSIEILTKSLTEIKKINGTPVLINLGYKQRQIFENYCKKWETRSVECESHKRDEYMGIPIKWVSSDSKFEIKYI